MDQQSKLAIADGELRALGKVYSGHLDPTFAQFSISSKSSFTQAKIRSVSILTAGIGVTHCNSVTTLVNV